MPGDGLPDIWDHPRDLSGCIERFPNNIALRQDADATFFPYIMLSKLRNRTVAVPRFHVNLVAVVKAFWRDLHRWSR